MSSHTQWWSCLFKSPCFPVVLGLFLQSMFYVGTIKSIGIMINEISTSLHTTSTDIGIILGFFSLLTCLPAPCFCLTHKHIPSQYRRVPPVIGSVMISSGFMMASCASNKIHMVVFLSISGIGQCTVLISLGLILNELSERYNLLYSVGLTGSGVGMVIPPLVAQLLLDTYGWRGAMLIIGALMANMIPCASVLRVSPEVKWERADSAGQGKPKSQDQRFSKTEGQPLFAGEPEHSSQYDSQSESVALLSLITTREHLSVKPTPSDEQTQRSHAAEYQLDLTRQSTDCSERYEKEYLCTIPSEDECDSFTQESSVPLLTQKHHSKNSKTSVPSHSVEQCQSRSRTVSINKITSRAEFTESLNSSSDVSQGSVGECQDKQNVKREDKRAFVLAYAMRILDDIGSSMFFTDPWVNFMLLSLHGIGFVYSGWHCFLIPDALQRGISPYRTLFITFLAAIGNVLGRVLAGVLTHALVSPASLYLAMCLIDIAALLGYAFVTNIFLMASLTFVSAMVIAGRAMLASIVARERVSKDQFGVAYAASEVTFGIGTLIGGYVSGMIADRFASYDATFKILATVDVLVLLLMLPMKLVKKPPGRADDDFQ